MKCGIRPIVAECDAVVIPMLGQQGLRVTDAESVNHRSWAMVDIRRCWDLRPAVLPALAGATTMISPRVVQLRQKSSVSRQFANEPESRGIEWVVKPPVPLRHHESLGQHRWCRTGLEFGGRPRPVKPEL